MKSKEIIEMELLEEKFFNDPDYNVKESEEDSFYNEEDLDEMKKGIVGLKAWTLPTKKVSPTSVCFINYKNTPHRTAPQNFCIDNLNKDLYITQKSGDTGDIAISRYKYDFNKKTSQYCDSMVLEGNGH